MNEIEINQKSKRGGKREGAGRKRKIGKDIDWRIVGYEGLMQTRRISIPEYYTNDVIHLVNTLLKLEELEDSVKARELKTDIIIYITKVLSETEKMPKKKNPTKASVIASAEQGSLFDFCPKSVDSVKAD